MNAAAAPVKKESAREHLEGAGVQFPPGASAGYLPGPGVLVVRNTNVNLDLVEEILKAEQRDREFYAKQEQIRAETLKMTEAKNGDAVFHVMLSFQLRAKGNQIEIVDSHTAGEPTRCVLSGGPNLGSGSMAERLAILREEYDVYRRAILLEAIRNRLSTWLTPLDSTCGLHISTRVNAGYDIDALCRIADEEGVGIYRGDIFSSAGRASNILVFGFGGTPEQQITKGISLLASGWQSQNGSLGSRV